VGETNEQRNLTNGMNRGPTNYLPLGIPGKYVGFPSSCKLLVMSFEVKYYSTLTRRCAK
jgi:hypothetical protein